MSSSATPKTSSLAALPAPKSGSASAAAAAGFSPPSKHSASPDKPNGKDSDEALFEAKMTKLLEKVVSSKLDKIVEKRLAIAALPKPTNLKANTNAPVGQGILAQLQANAGLEKPDESDESTDDISDPDDPSAASAATAAAAAAPSKKPARVAPSMLEQVSLYGSVQSYVKTIEWKNARNRHECEAIAQAVDMLLKERVSKNSTGIEILLRRLSGVQLADHVGEWKVADSVAWNPQGNSLLPRDEVRRALKDAEQLKRLYSSASGQQSKRGGFGQQRGGGRGGYGKKNAWSDRKSGQQTASAAGASGAAAPQS